MSNNFRTNSAENATLKKRLEKLILASQELKSPSELTNEDFQLEWL